MFQGKPKIFFRKNLFKKAVMLLIEKKIQKFNNLYHTGCLSFLPVRKKGKKLQGTIFPNFPA